jgi:hypothetical protein
MAVTEFEQQVIGLLTRIAVAVEGKPAARPKVAEPVDLFAVNEERAARGKKPARPMPQPFPMAERHVAFAAAHGMVGKAAEHQFQRFTSYHGAKGSVFASWDQAWQTWVLKQREFNGTAPQTRPPSDGMDGRI